MLTIAGGVALGILAVFVFAYVLFILENWQEL
jgi:hypothetical protein